MRYQIEVLAPDKTWVRMRYTGTFKYAKQLVEAYFRVFPRTTFRIYDLDHAKYVCWRDKTGWHKGAQ